MIYFTNYRVGRFKVWNYLIEAVCWLVLVLEIIIAALFFVFLPLHLKHSNNIHFVVTPKPPNPSYLGKRKRTPIMPSYDKRHYKVVQNILRYLKETQNLGIKYEWKNVALILEGFADPEYPSDPNDRRSVSGVMFMLNACRGSDMAESEATVHRFT